MDRRKETQVNLQSERNWKLNPGPGGRSLLTCLLCLLLAGIASRSEAQFKTLHHFTGEADGANPTGLMQASDGNLYGTTETGGGKLDGTFFRITPAGALTTLHTFHGSLDGRNPVAGVIQASDGNLYGTTYQGGKQGGGTIFKQDLAGSFTTLHLFDRSDGYPSALLLQASDGNLYGATVGSVFMTDLMGNLTTLQNLKASLGGPLMQASDGNLYGCEYWVVKVGSGKGERLYLEGDIFRMSLSGELTLIQSFNELSGVPPPYGPLMQASDGYLYATAPGGTLSPIGVPYPDGLVFKMDLAGNVTVAHVFNGADGRSPAFGLIEGADGNFYGTTQGGGAHGLGTVFKMDAAGNVTTLHSFNGRDGYDPNGLIQAKDGYLYGTTRLDIDPLRDAGTVFRLNP